jgi:hypothetical protein
VPTIKVSWWHTEHFEAEIEMDDDFDIDADDADDQLEEKICELDQDELSEAFEGCTDREITEKEVVE